MCYTLFLLIFLMLSGISNTFLHKSPPLYPIHLLLLLLEPLDDPPVFSKLALFCIHKSQNLQTCSLQFGSCQTPWLTPQNLFSACGCPVDWEARCLIPHCSCMLAAVSSMLKLIFSELQHLPKCAVKGVPGPSLPFAPVLWVQEPAYFLDQPEMIFNRSAAEHVISQLQAGIDMETTFHLDEVPLLLSHHFCYI